MNRAENAAKIIVEALINGATMHFHTKQSSGECDFTLEYSEGMKVPLEVTSATNQRATGTQAAIKNSKYGGPFISRGNCAHDWAVHPLPSAKINDIRKHAACYLVKIEAEGREEFNAYTDATESQAVEAIFQKLKIGYGKVTSWRPPGRIGIMFPIDGGLVDPMLVNKAVETEATKEDNKRKLNIVAGSEKHLFVYFDSTSEHVVWAAARDEAPPLVGPQLPPEMTHVWMAAWAGERGWHTVWRAQRGFRWIHEGRVNIDTGEWRSVNF